MNTFVISDSVEGNTIAAPTPITARAAISWPGLSVSPPARLAKPNTDRPASSIPLRPKRSDRLPAASTDAANSRLNASTTHCSCELDACSWRTSVGSATLTIVVSRLITNAASSSEIRITGLRFMAPPRGLTCVMQGRLAAESGFCQASQLRLDVVLQRDYPDQVCSIARSLEIVGERWTLLILRDAVLGLTRFEEFQENLGIASNVLTNRLKLLCDERCSSAFPTRERPGRPKYVLTDKGAELGSRPDRAHEVGRPPLPDAERPAPTHAPRRLRRQHRPRPPLRPLRQTGRTRRDRTPPRPRSAARSVTQPTRDPLPPSVDLPRFTRDQLARSTRQRRTMAGEYARLPRIAGLSRARGDVLVATGKHDCPTSMIRWSASIGRVGSAGPHFASAQAC